MGFGLGQQEWEGPRSFTFTLHRPRTKRTARYDCQEQAALTFYAPQFMLHGLKFHSMPERIEVVIGKSGSPVRTLGFRSEAIPLHIEPNVCEYEFVKGNMLGKPIKHSKRYEFRMDSQIYSLYIPNEIFEGLPYPRRVFVKIGIPSEV